MDKIVSKLVALGVPGIILLSVMGGTGYVGAAAITASLVLIGPFGILGGIATLGVITLIADGLSKYGFESIFTNVARGIMAEKGLSVDEMVAEVSKFPVSRSLKRTIIANLKDLEDLEGPVEPEVKDTNEESESDTTEEPIVETTEKTEKVE